ncbi:N-acetylneuraminate (7)9-O-acetyltransferase-like [Glandiceps talaboti]
MAITSHPNDFILTYINVTTAKYVAFVLAVVLVTIHGVKHVYEESDTCQVLLDDGYHLSYRNWQPRGCMMHQYSISEGEYCMKDKHIMLIGDSRVRQLFFEFARLLSDNDVTEGKEHENLSHYDKSSGIKLDFVWMPEVNHSVTAFYEELSKRSDLPNIIIHGSATWAIKYHNATQAAFEEYKTNLTLSSNAMNRVGEETDVFWLLQAPVEHNRLHEVRKMITNEQINLYNNAAQKILSLTTVRIWKSAAKVAEIDESTLDGIHLKEQLLEIDVQLILNWYCNKHYKPFDGGLYCCQEIEQLTLVQLVTFGVFISCLLLGIILKIQKKYKALVPQSSNHTAPSQSESTVITATSNGDQILNGPVPDVENAAVMKKEKEKEKEITCTDYADLLWALGKFGLIMIYFYICDRSGFIPREQKLYTHLRFFLPLCYVTLLGLFFNAKTSQTVVLNRDQTEEWKGWMQLVILIYHYSGASGVLPIYMHIRILVAMYLFQTGYGHFSFFWSKADYGIIRFCQVQFRLNWLVFILCLVMNRPYQFYYFVPLVSFWFVLVYITMSLWPRASAKSVTENSSDYVWMVCKFIGMVGIIVTVAISEVSTILLFTSVFFYKIFNWWPLKEIFVTADGRLYEWWFRWQLDRFIVPFGMLFAFVYITLKKYKKLEDSNSTDNLWSGCGAYALMFLGICMVTSYTVFACLCPNKPACNQTHSYISVLPVAGFILLRNVPGRLRARYSTFFAWFGKISLETFIGQYHIWLAADTKGTLVLVPNYPEVNLIVTSFIFLCTAHEISALTVQLQGFFVPKDLKELFKRLSVVICVVTVLAFFHKGFHV